MGATLAKSLFVLLALLHLVPVLVYLERKLSAWIQDRRGPNRVGPWGVLQPVADAVKLLFKEEVIPAGADRGLYRWAPALAFVPPMLAFAAIPFGNRIGTESLVVSDIPVGVLFVLTIGSLSVYGIAFGGWASNNKWALLGGVRSSAQMVSYEVALGLALVSVLMVSGNVGMQEIVRRQTGSFSLAGVPLPAWNVFQQPVAFVVFMAAAFAENNRLPFDLPECETELVAGYHTEYSSMRFALFFMGEYVAMITMSGLAVTLFLGGWHLDPFTDPDSGTWAQGAISVLVFGAKTLAVLLVYIWVRWTLPRFRYDQLMGLGWKGLVPLALANVAATALIWGPEAGTMP
ncbi:MAG: NADH-quinone oxidoreductase subunit NuoH [Planctomycetes bacterium]|nr:NADH-quinone oxidoreductase subunit NuoH [Planctomycetota bacterium]